MQQLNLLRFTLLPGTPLTGHLAKTAGLRDFLKAKDLRKLAGSEAEVEERLSYQKILDAQNATSLEDALVEGLEIAVPYYMRVGEIIWRGVEQNHDSLLHLSQTSSKTIEDLFFHSRQALERDVLIRSVASLRVVAAIGELRIKDSKAKAALGQEFDPPARYFMYACVIGMLATCLMKSWETPSSSVARRRNLVDISTEMRSGASMVYKDAMQDGLFKNATKATRMFWQLESQEGEVEADLDILESKTRPFDSMKDYLAATKTS